MYKMRIVITRSNPINPDSRVEKEADSLLKDGHQVIILGWDRSNNYRIKEEKIALIHGTATIYRFGVRAEFGGGIKKNLIPMIRIQHLMYQWLKDNRHQYDIIHACDFDNGFTALRIHKKYNKKYVYDIFDYYVASHSIPGKLSSLIEKKDMQVINNAECTIICSEQRREQIINSNPKRVEIIENSPSEELLEKTSRNFVIKSNNKKTKIAYVGILSRARLIREMLSVVSAHDEFELHIAGFGQLYEEILKYSNENSNIYFYGKIQYEDALQLENQCDIMTAIYDPNVPNHKYAAPNKFYEAMMLGKPLIMVKNTGMDRIISDNNLGEIIEFNSDGFEKAILSLNSRKNEWDCISKKMKSLYSEKYSWEIMDQRLRKIYADLSC